MFSDFTYNDLRLIYDKLRIRNLNCLKFGDLADTPAAPPTYFLIRHDLDYSLSKATELAHRERDWGYRSTYFVLLSCDHYNLLSREGTKAVRELAGLGHEVGLHYDVQVMVDRGTDMNIQLEFELSVLADICGRPVRSIAMHNPSIYGDDPFAGVKFVVNAYRKDIIEEGGYYSDSAGAWRDHAVDALCNGSFPGRVQLLIHPVLWDSGRGGRLDRLNAWRARKLELLDNAVVEIQNIWAAHSGVQQHDWREANKTQDDPRGDGRAQRQYGSQRPES